MCKSHYTWCYTLRVCLFFSSVGISFMSRKSIKSSSFRCLFVVNIKPFYTKQQAMAWWERKTAYIHTYTTELITASQQLCYMLRFYLLISTGAHLSLRMMCEYFVVVVFFFSWVCVCVNECVYAHLSSRCVCNIHECGLFVSSELKELPLIQHVTTSLSSQFVAAVSLLFRLV